MSLGQVWGHTEQRLGFGGGPSAPDLWGWKQWLGRCCLARCRGTSLFSFPAPVFPSSPHSPPLQQAHPVRWPLDSTFLHADLFAAASACSHSEVGNKAGDRGDVGERSGGLPQGPWLQGLEGTWGEEEWPLRLVLQYSANPKNLDCFLYTLHLLLVGEA